MRVLTIEERYRGAMLGLACGDALGTTLEFREPGSFEPITDMVGGGPFGLQPGQWTDDTSMAIALAESLVECRGFDAHDQMDRYVRWWREGYASSTGRCFDIGNTVSAALARYEDSGNPLSGSEDPGAAGNGSLMRLVPVPLAYRRTPARAHETARVSSRTTHAAAECLDACRLWTAYILAVLEGAERAEVLERPWQALPGFGPGDELEPAVQAIAEGSFRHRDPPQIRGTGYVVESLEAALWAFDRSGGFREGALLAANLGHDADTTAAIYGQLAGAYYGEAGIPAQWRARLSQYDRLAGLGDALLRLSGGTPSGPCETGDPSAVDSPGLSEDGWFRSSATDDR
ncbi:MULTISPECIES: ADP-ribosylglycohydrolase family protein [unclassified Thioalkalivibrio]|uniref:ADP-ribosylglycohydrolase family protein n=1 Tax=unclassified Thioalkalivibrio TaxID=2621013 RepID=UPI000360AB59|nr:MULTISPECIES: ADP-ribosylglycohydrolase family protein [unclassified Thioalkalivibrio]